MWKVLVAGVCGVGIVLGAVAAYPSLSPDAVPPEGAVQGGAGTWERVLSWGVEWMCPATSTDPACLAKQRAIGHMWADRRDLERARVWYARAAEAGDREAMFHLGWVTEELAATTPQAGASTAVEWYRRSAEAGFPPAMNNLGAVMARSADSKADQAAAFRWFLSAAKAGNPVGRLNVANAYVAGFGVRQDPARAPEWSMWRAKSRQSDDLSDVVLPRTRVFGADQLTATDFDRLRRAATTGHTVLVSAGADGQPAAGGPDNPLLRRR